MSEFTDENGNCPVEPGDAIGQEPYPHPYRGYYSSEFLMEQSTQADDQLQRMDTEQDLGHRHSPSPPPFSLDVDGSSTGSRRRWPSVTPDRYLTIRNNLLTPRWLRNANESGEDQQAHGSIPQPGPWPNYMAVPEREPSPQPSETGFLSNFQESQPQCIGRQEEFAARSRASERPPTPFISSAAEPFAKKERQGSIWDVQETAPVGVSQEGYSQQKYEPAGTEAYRGYGKLTHSPSFADLTACGNDSKMNYSAGMNPFETLSLSASERRSNFERRQKRKRRYGSTVDDVDMGSDQAVNMTLEEVIIQNKITYNRNHSSNSKGQSGSKVETYKDFKKLRMTHDSEDMNMDEESNGALSNGTVTTSPRNNGRGRFNRDARQVIVDGSNVAFEYGNNVSFDWEGIERVVSHLMELGCCDIKVVIPEERLRTPGMSKNEHVIKNLRAGYHLLPCWESRDEKIFIVKSAHRKNGVIVSNNIWNFISTGRYNKLRNFTLGYEFRTWPTSVSLKTLNGQPLEEILWM